MTPVSLAQKLSQIRTHWYPHVIADHNDNDAIVVGFEGKLPYHLHEETDDFFLVIEPKGVPNTGDPATISARPRH